ncbi:putative P-loop ATPase [Bradyrhizobium sp. LB14.3]|uniref:virulence-associated E family protein n=1 Tax=Bradyrhizobium sp. LB14.3 TaxID=3156328 RepID=UPI0033913226
MSKHKSKKTDVATIVDTAIMPAASNGTRLIPLERKDVIWPEVVGRNAPAKNSMMNALKVIEELGLDCRYDVFHNRKMIDGTNLSGFHGELSDAVTRKVRELSWSHLDYDPGTEATYQAVLRECEENRFNPILDYLTRLRWDGRPRLDTWLTRYLGVKDTPLVRAQGEIVLTAAVARIMKPGCKFDHVLVLEGPEGKGKSSVVQVLANGRRGCNDNFSDSPILAVDERKQQELTRGVWFYEMAELAGMRKADQFAIKNFITKQEDRARPAYGRFEEVQPRSCVFIGTFNTTAGGDLIEYLNVGDQRRWWPVLIGDIDVEALECDRDQLFAEAMANYDLDMPLYLRPKLEAAARDEAAQREVTDPLADALSDLNASVLKMLHTKIAPNGAGVSIANHNDGKLLTVGDHAIPSAFVTESEIWVSAKYVTTCLPSSRQNDAKGVGAALRKQGWTNVEDRRAGTKLRGYVRDRYDLDDLLG